MQNAQDMAVAGIEAATLDANNQYSQGALIDLLFGTNRPSIQGGPAGRDWGASEINSCLFDMTICQWRS